MSMTKRINNTDLRLIRGDITDMELEAIVYYADSNLKLGAGFGNAIAMRGGLSITKELDQIGSVGPCEAVVTSAGKLKAKNIIHTNGPKFQEPDIENKLKTTILNTLKLAEEKGFKQIAFPPMGTGFYGIPLPVSADVMIDTFKEYFSNQTILEDVIIGVIDNYEYSPFEAKLETI